MSVIKFPSLPSMPGLPKFGSFEGKPSPELASEAGAVLADIAAGLENIYSTPDYRDLPETQAPQPANVGIDNRVYHLREIGQRYDLAQDARDRLNEAA